MGTDLLLYDLADFRIVPQVLLRILSALAYLIALVGIPGAGLHHNVQIRRQIQDIALPGDALAEHDIELRLLERRGHLILHHLDPGVVADHLSSLLQGLHPPHVHAHGGIELQGPAAGGGLRIAEHDADLLTELVDEDHHAVGLADDGGQLPQGLGHQTGLKAYMALAHVPVNLGLGDQRRHRVHHHDVDGAGAHHGLRNLQGLLSVVRLGDIEVVYVHADILGIYGIQGMFCVDESRDAALLLHLGHHVQGDRRLTAGLRSVYLHDPPLGNPPQPQRDVKAQGTCGNGLHVHLGSRVAQLHHSALSVLLLNLADCRVQCF